MISYEDLQTFLNFLHQNAAVHIPPASQEPLQHDDSHLTGSPSKDKKQQCRNTSFTLVSIKDYIYSQNMVQNNTKALFKII